MLSTLGTKLAEKLVSLEASTNPSPRSLERIMLPGRHRIDWGRARYHQCEKALNQLLI